MPQRTYLDHNATSPLRPEARAAMLAALDVVGNPSSVHTEGRAARAVVETAREHVAALIGAEPSEIVFTSGATEANAWVVGAGWDRIVAPAVEHESVLAPARAMGDRFAEVPVDSGGIVDVSALVAGAASAQAVPGAVLVAVQFANSETGVVQDVPAVAASCRDHGLRLHCDAVQAAGRVPLDVREIGCDFLSLSAHKLGGPKGVGALFIRKGLDLEPLVRGGGQERRRRAGTENVAAIAGFGAAADAARRDLPTMERLVRLRDGLERNLAEMTPDLVVIGAGGPRLAQTSCVAAPGVRAETLLIKLDMAGIAASAGSACSSGKVGTSHVLAAMGVPDDVARTAIRISLGWTTSEIDLETFSTTWKRVAGASPQRAVA